MKPLFLILGLLLAVAAGVVGGTLSAPSGPARTSEALQPSPPLQPAVAISPEVLKRIEALSMEIATLETQIAALREEKSRVPVALSPAPELSSVPNESTETFVAAHRDAILKVMADERAEQERKREAERKEREEQQLANKAERVAEKLALNDAQKRQLAEYYVFERQKIEEFRAQYREARADGSAPENPRDAFREAREWRTNELTRLFGTDLGAQINEFENGPVRGEKRANAGGGKKANAAGAQDGADQNGAGLTAPRPGGGR